MQHQWNSTTNRQSSASEIFNTYSEEYSKNNNDLDRLSNNTVQHTIPVRETSKNYHNRDKRYYTSET